MSLQPEPARDRVLNVWSLAIWIFIGRNKETIEVRFLSVKYLTTMATTTYPDVDMVVNIMGDQVQLFDVAKLVVPAW